MAYVDVLRVGIGTGDCSKLHSTLIVLEDRHAPHPYTRPRETPNLPHKLYFFHYVCEGHVSAHFCVLETHITNSPVSDLLSAAIPVLETHITNSPVSDLLSAAIPA